MKFNKNCYTDSNAQYCAEYFRRDNRGNSGVVGVLGRQNCLCVYFAPGSAGVSVREVSNRAEAVAESVGNDKKPRRGDGEVDHQKRVVSTGVGGIGIFRGDVGGIMVWQNFSDGGGGEDFMGRVAGVLKR